ncbi:hypothetical protein, conserved [Plasmodium gonderi]|uniref:Uncharacterized protein n=1 Tax=Plasmodium gonderi TaxID=77519 RepID=A0A1Y1JKQ7_PLAGO|nr:hypothetical protein, conserved [Plasmodium gonderi]GAW82880.1 hypothetical protein, conserved [Plasmodium gonderi]
MQNIIDTYEIIGKIDDRKSISSNSLLSHEECNDPTKGVQEDDKIFVNGERREKNSSDNKKCIESIQDKQYEWAEAGVAGEDGEAGGTKKGKENVYESNKIKCQMGNVNKSKSSTLENMRTHFPKELEIKKDEANVCNLNKGGYSNLIRIQKEITRPLPNGEESTNQDLSVKEKRKNSKSEILENGNTDILDMPTVDSPNGSFKYEKTSQISSCQNRSKKHYKVLIHAPACWKGEKFNSTPFIFVYDKSSNFFTYSESPLEIEKYIIDTSAEDFESRVLTIIFYDSVFACSTSSLMLNNNKAELQHLPKPLSVFYLPLCKLDLCNDSVKYRLGLRTNSILCDINIKEAISLFNNSSKITGPNVNKFSLHLILKNNNYSDSHTYNYLNYQTKFYGVPRSNLSSCVQIYKMGNNDKVHSNVANRYLINSSKSQVNTFKNHQTDPNQFISLEKLKNKWENYTHMNRANSTNGTHNTLRKKETKLTSYSGKNEKDSVISRIKSEVLLTQNGGTVDCRTEGYTIANYGESVCGREEKVTSNNAQGKGQYKENTAESSYKYDGTKSLYDLMQGSNEKAENDFDVKDDVFPEDSASMINVFEKESILSERGKKTAERSRSTLNSNFKTANSMYSCVKSLLRKRGGEIGNPSDENVRKMIGHSSIEMKQEDMNINVNKNHMNRQYEEEENCNLQDKNNTLMNNIKDKFGEDRSVCYSQIENLRYFNTNNSVCSSYGKNDENLILAMKEIKQWMEKIEDKVSTISCDKSELNIGNGNNNNDDKKYNKILTFLIKSVKNNIKLKNKCIYRSCYLNIRNLYLLKKNDKVKFENKLLLRNYGNLKSKYKNVLVNLCKKNLLIKYYSIKDKFHYSKKYENMMRHLQQEKNDLLHIIEEKKYEQENSLNINLMLSEELKKMQEDKESMLNTNFLYKSEKDKITTKCEILLKDVDHMKEEIEYFKLENENMKKQMEKMKQEKEQIKHEKEQIKHEKEQIKHEKESLIKELGDTKAKYFNLTGILEGEEKMYSRKVEELEKKIENITEEKNTLIKEIKNEIDNFTKMLSDKEEENASIKEKLKELKNIEEKYKDTQINFDSLKKEFEKSFDEVQIILKEMIQKEKEYTKKYNHSIKCLENEHKEIVEKLLNEKELSLNETNYFKDMCKNHCNKMTTFDENLTTAEKLLDHVLSQYPQLFNEFKINSRNNVLNKSFGKMHYENIQAARDNIKLIRKSLSQFKMSFKNSSFNFQIASDYSKKYCTQKKISYPLSLRNKRIISNLKNYEGFSKEPDHHRDYPYLDEEFTREQDPEPDPDRRRSISNHTARNISIISSSRKNINLKNKIDSYNTNIQKHSAQSRSRSGSVFQKYKSTPVYDELKKIQYNRKDILNTNAINGYRKDDISNNHIANVAKSAVDMKKEKDDDMTQRNVMHHPDKGSPLRKDAKCDTISKDDKHTDSFSYCSEHDIHDDVCKMDNVEGKREDWNLDLSNDVNQLNNMDIVNMYEENGYFNENVGENIFPNVENNIQPNIDSDTYVENKKKKDLDITEGRIKLSKSDSIKSEIKKNSKTKENYEFDKNNFKEIISFIEQNVIKNSESINQSENAPKNIDSMKKTASKKEYHGLDSLDDDDDDYDDSNGRGEVNHNSGIMNKCANEYEGLNGHGKEILKEDYKDIDIDKDNSNIIRGDKRSPRKIQQIKTNENSPIICQKSSNTSKQSGMYKNPDKANKYTADNLCSQTGSNTSKVVGTRGIATSNNKNSNPNGHANVPQGNRSKNASNVVSVTNPLVSTWRKNSSTIYRKANESVVCSNNNDDASKMHMSKNYKYKQADESVKNVKKDNSYNLKCVKSSIIKKNLIFEKSRNLSTNTK